MIGFASFAALRSNEEGAMAIETAIVAPVLLLLSLGGFQVSSLVARQTELQAAMAEAQAVALATDPDTSAKLTTIQQIVMASTNLGASAVTVTNAYRCNSTASYVTSTSYCAVGDKVSSYVKISVTDSYNPIWTQFGIGKAISMNQTRYIQYKQATKS